MRSFLAFPLKVLHKLYGTGAALLLGALALVGFAFGALAVLVVIVFGCLWFLIALALTSAGLGLNQMARYVDPAYGVGKQLTSTMAETATLMYKRSMN